ncbi:hypothetical protein FHU41_001856 [Psychromicrobium silvestre]|uniref:Uncharacterized protein n=1 Tax=Psychromicrobium silvestre TaxID=1645614 RepID=A0A7Y9LU27_9MICC|nr:hypothetical protein [Psychromicrobium silvestre]
MWKKLIASFRIIVAAGSFGLTAVPTAAAAGNCYFDSCKGKDPQSSGCSVGAYTIGYFWGGKLDVPLAVRLRGFGRLLETVTFRLK